MPGTAVPSEGETLAQFLDRLGLSIDEFYNLNPEFNAEAWVAGAQFNVPDAATAPAATSEAPTGVLAGGAQGLFEDMLKDFRKAFQTFLSAPGFIQNIETAVSGRRQAAGKAAQPGWTTQEAEFLRANEDIYQQRYEEQVQRQFAETGELPTLTAAEFLRTISPRTEMEMRSSEARGGRPRVPSVGVRRLRF